MVTMKLRRDLAILRRGETYAVVREALEVASDRLGMRIVAFTVMADHIHMVVEGEDAAAVSRAMQGLSVRIARALNRLWNRRGQVFRERYHNRVLSSPRAARFALRYVLLNARKHGSHHPSDLFDPFSSAAWFDGWSGEHSLPFSKPPVAPAETWLLRSGWKRSGLINPRDIPGPLQV